MTGYPGPLAYDSARDYLGGKDSRPVANNTRLHTSFNGYAIRLHGTGVLTVYPDGWIVMRSGGWETRTTQSRINAYLPGGWSVYSRRGTWHLYASGRPILEYRNGLAVHPDGRVGIVTGYGSATPETLLTPVQVATLVQRADDERDAREAQRIARYARQHPYPRALSDASVRDRWHIPSMHGRGYWHRDGCVSCAAEYRDISARYPTLLAADHAAGLHSGRDTFGYARGCPWGCPMREGR